MPEYVESKHFWIGEGKPSKFLVVLDQICLTQAPAELLLFKQTPDGWSLEFRVPPKVERRLKRYMWIGLAAGLGVASLAGLLGAAWSLVLITFGMAFCWYGGQWLVLWSIRRCEKRLRHLLHYYETGPTLAGTYPDSVAMCYRTWRAGALSRQQVVVVEDLVRRGGEGPNFPSHRLVLRDEASASGGETTIFTSPHWDVVQAIGRQIALDKRITVLRQQALRHLSLAVPSRYTYGSLKPLELAYIRFTDSSKERDAWPGDDGEPPAMGSIVS